MMSSQNTPEKPGAYCRCCFIGRSSRCPQGAHHDRPYGLSCLPFARPALRTNKRVRAHIRALTVLRAFAHSIGTSRSCRRQPRSGFQCLDPGSRLCPGCQAQCRSSSISRRSSPPRKSRRTSGSASERFAAIYRPARPSGPFAPAETCCSLPRTSRLWRRHGVHAP
jgi:hypothetical protein